MISKINKNNFTKSDFDKLSKNSEAIAQKHLFQNIKKIIFYQFLFLLKNSYLAKN